MAPTMTDDRTTRTPAVTRLLTFAGLFVRPMTLGVRGLVVDGEGRALLVRHTYVPGWYLPGGGVERGETLLDALTRELVEEGHIELLSPPALHGVYLNKAASARDHVALYVVREFRSTGPFVPNREIAEIGFFSPQALPDGVTRATQARIEEALSGAPVSAYW